MLRRIALSLLLAGIAACAADDMKAVEDAERGWAAGITKKDYALLDKVLADDLIYRHSNALVDTKASYIESSRSGKSNYISIEYKEPIQPKLIGKDLAMAFVRATVTTMQNGKPNPMDLAMLHIFRKKGGQWQMIAHQSARIPLP
jgi:ketosteroid isomerase-like protein